MNVFFIPHQCFSWSILPFMGNLQTINGLKAKTIHVSNRKMPQKFHCGKTNVHSWFNYSNHQCN